MRRAVQEDSDEFERENMEEASEGIEDFTRIAPWNKQLTIRGVIASIFIGIIYSVVAMKINLNTGLVPNLNVSAALVAFVFMRAWKKVVEFAGFTSSPFTRQENTIIQTSAVSCYAMAMGGGFASYLLGMSRKTYELAGGAQLRGNSEKSIKDPGLDWMMSFLFLTAFVGLFALIPLRKVLIVDYKLTYPSGTATAVLINGFHTPKGNKMAKKQVRGFTKFFSISFLWGFFQWFFSGGPQCGFVNFPTFGLKARTNSFYFDFSPTYVGAGMICSHIVNFSLLLGAVLSWGIMWPLIRTRKGDWYSVSIPESSMNSLSGYKVFVPIALILGDGLYQFIKTLFFTGRNLYITMNKKRDPRTYPDDKNEPLDDEDRKRNEVFLRDSIPIWVACVGYVTLSVISIIVIPIMFPPLKWYFVVVAYIIAPALSFCNAYGTGLTDLNMGYNYGKVALFVIAAMSGAENGVVAGLIGCGLIKSIITLSSDLMHDLKTGHITLTSPRAMIISQAIGTAVGCIVAPLTFFLFYKAFDVGNPDGEYTAPYALIYRNMAILGVEGFSALPKNCLELCYGFFAFAVLANVFRDMTPKSIGKYTPIPMAMAAPFLVGGYFAIDMCVGSLIVYAWQKINRKKSDLMVPAVASGLICGDGMWMLPSSILALAKIRRPICMTFLASTSTSY